MRGRIAAAATAVLTLTAADSTATGRGLLPRLAVGAALIALLTAPLIGTVTADASGTTESRATGRVSFPCNQDWTGQGRFKGAGGLQPRAYPAYRRDRLRRWEVGAADKGGGGRALRH